MKFISMRFVACAGMETASGGVAWAWFSWLSREMLVQAVFLFECVLTWKTVCPVIPLYKM